VGTKICYMYSIVKTGLWDSGKVLVTWERYLEKKRIEATTSAPAASASLLDGQFFEGLRNHRIVTQQLFCENKKLRHPGKRQRNGGEKETKNKNKKRERRKVLCRDTETARQVNEYSFHDDVSPNESSWTFRPEDDASLELCVPDRCVPTLCRWPLKSRHNQSHHEVRPYHSPSKGLLVRGHIVQGDASSGGGKSGSFPSGNLGERRIDVRPYKMQLEMNMNPERQKHAVKDWMDRKKNVPLYGIKSAEGKASCLEKSSNYHRLPLWLYPADRDRGRRRGIKL